MIKVGINGFGRIGRFVFRAAQNRNDIQIVGINDLCPVDYLAYMLKYDTMHGQFNGTIEADVENSKLIVNGKEIRVTACKDPKELAWNEVGAEYVVESTGLFLTQEDVDKSPKLNNSVKVGDIKYKDISGPDGVPDGVISPEYDRVLLGGSLPHYMFGLTFNAAYKGWDFGLTLQGVGSQKSQISAAMIEGLRDNWLNFPTILDGNYWSPKNTDEQNATAKYPRLTRTNRDANFCMSDYWLYNGRYIRLKNLSVGYTLPKAWTTKACMNTVRLYVSGSDLFTISNAPKGWDPEVSTEGYPITTSLIFGVSINF